MFHWISTSTFRKVPRHRFLVFRSHSWCSQTERWFDSATGGAQGCPDTGKPGYSTGPLTYSPFQYKSWTESKLSTPDISICKTSLFLSHYYYSWILKTLTSNWDIRTWRSQIIQSQPLFLLSFPLISSCPTPTETDLPRPTLVPHRNHIFTTFKLEQFISRACCVYQFTAPTHWRT